jgi:transcriptional regulator with XRE-family HTH domain
MDRDTCQHDTSLPASAKIGQAVLMDWRERMKQGRLRANRMSQEQLGDIVGVSQSTIASYEKPDGNEPTLDQLRKIAEALSMTPEYLIFGIGNADDVSVDTTGLDRYAMARVIELFLRRLQQKGVNMAPAKQAKLILAVYDIMSEMADGTVLEQEVERLIEMASRRG